MTIDSVTTLDSRHAGAVIVGGSHGGLIAAYLVARARARAAIFNDAGGGKDNAGVAGLAMLQEIGMAASAVDVRTARIGDGEDVYHRGMISAANDAARKVGVEIGQPCMEAAERLAAASVPTDQLSYREARFPIAADIGREVWGLDSASLVLPADVGRVLVIGSHGGLLGGDSARALKVDASFAFFNDAGVGIDGAGITRLPALQKRNIGAAVVDYLTARIGDARSAWDTGVVSHTNERAARMGVKRGQTVQQAVLALGEWFASTSLSPATDT